ncbi:hypothetical protein SAMN05216456_3092 [Devosia crocina]|uniref:HTH cro/C1-type domain-containing protein n=1 Tax=Devosia crocina TaxID=429728 RepID=A0A1I7NSX2_9HYPH|nr:helix-turn-helix transcriptional regulator [Devosia crocina]SFV37771.1 hypothetical protein SAMN05216456_3092 [Devosia crocina]
MKTIVLTAAAAKQFDGLPAAASGIEVIALQEIEEGKRLIDRKTAACVSDVLNVPFEWLTP